MNRQLKRELSRFILNLWKRQNENNTKLTEGENND